MILLSFSFLSRLDRGDDRYILADVTSGSSVVGAGL